MEGILMKLQKVMKLTQKQKVFENNFSNNYQISHYSGRKHPLLQGFIQVWLLQNLGFAVTPGVTPNSLLLSHFSTLGNRD
jgi:hypothetical protein